MSRHERRVGYAIAVAGTVAVLLLRMALSGILAEQARLMPFVVAVMAAAWWGGLRPGILATILGAVLGVYFIVPPLSSLWITTLHDGVNLVLFVLIGLTISWLCEALHRARCSEAEKQFRTLADSILQLVWMARPDGYRFWFNQRWLDYSGMTIEALKGTGWQTVCDPAELPRVLTSWQAALAKGVPWEETYPLRRVDGRTRWHLARAVPVRDDARRDHLLVWNQHRHSRSHCDGTSTQGCGRAEEPVSGDPGPRTSQPAVSDQQRGSTLAARLERRGQDGAPQNSHRAAGSATGPTDR